jgi:hypothetical protein
MTFPSPVFRLAAVNDGDPTHAPAVDSKKLYAM